MYTFKLLDENDYEDFKQLINEFRETDFTRERYLKILSQVQRSSEIWLLLESGRPVSTGTLILEHKFIFNGCIYGHIEDVCVSATQRNKGLGKQIVQHLIRRAKELNCYKVTLDCADHNIPFYLKCGLEHRGNQMCQLLSNFPSI